MLFERRLWDGIASGSVTSAVRRWKRPTVRAGGNLRSPGGYLSIDAVTLIGDSDLTEQLAECSGFESLEALRDSLPPPSEGRRLYRIDFHVAGPDPRDTLRQDADLSRDELDDVAARLAAMDHRADAAWTRQTLEVIDAKPNVVSTELATDVHRPRKHFKRDVAKLKRLGLTISLSPGYRLSPRGRSVLDHLRAGDEDEA